MKHLIAGLGLLSNDHVENKIDPSRILHVDHKRNRLVVIPCEPRRSGGRVYFVKYRILCLDGIEEQLNLPDGKFKVREIKNRPIMRLSDSELRQRFPPKNEKLKPNLIIQRDRKWNLIYELVTGSNADLLFDSVLFKEIVHKEASEKTKNYNQITRQVRSITQAILQYFAFGSTKNALLPLWENCGARGIERVFTGHKLGRKNAPTKAGIEGVEGYVLDDPDFKIIRFCWDHYLKKGISVPEACRRMWREFYSFEEFHSDGQLYRELFPLNQRPTEKQFSYRGVILTGLSASEKQQRFNEYVHTQRPLVGSANDGVHAVGQKSALDSTSGDVEFVSLISRLDRIGTSHRTLVVDMLYGYIPGFYLGLTPPCSDTTKLAYLHSMMDKTEWLRNLGLDHPPEDWIPIHFQDGLGDNTESRSEQVHTELLDTGVMLSLQYVPTYRSDLNSMPEAAHHSMHRLIDHKMSGTTHGRKKDKKEESASLRARHTILEGYRESANAIHHYNTVPHPEWALPLEAKRERVKPTRLDMTRWAMRNGKYAVGLMDIDEARTHLLPVMDGVFTEKGVFLYRPDKGDNKVYIKRLRYVSGEESILKMIEAARRKGVIHRNFRVNPFDITNIWYLDIQTGELHQLMLKTDDVDLTEEATIADVVRLDQFEEIEKFQLRNDRDLALSRLEARLDEVKKNAGEEYDEELNGLNYKSSKTELVSSKSENRQREKTYTSFGIPMVVVETSITKDESDSYELSSDQQDTQVIKPKLPKTKNVFEKLVEATRNAKRS